MIDFSATALEAGIAVFGRAVTVHPDVSQPGGDPYYARGVFAAPHVPVDSFGIEAGISTTSPSLGIRLADFAIPPQVGDSVGIDAETYEIADMLPDGEGGVTLMLTS